MDELIEDMARALCDHQGRSWGALDFKAREAFLGKARAALAAIHARGDRIVPAEPTRLMDGEAAFVRDEAGSNHAIYTAMLSASPYAREPSTGRDASS